MPAKWYVVPDYAHDREPPIFLANNRIQFKVERYTKDKGGQIKDVTIPLTTADELKIARSVAWEVNTFLQRPQISERPADQVQNAASYSYTEQSRAEARKVDARYRLEQEQARRRAIEAGDPLELEYEEIKRRLPGAQTRRLLLRLTL